MALHAAIRRLLTAAAVAVALVVPVGVAHADAPADEVAAAVNAQRAGAGVGPLARDAALDAMAREWAAHLASATTFGHSTNAWRTDRARPGFTTCCGENIAAGQPTAAAAMDSWMGSDGHRRNILNAGYTHLGVGHVTVPGSQYRDYWVQVFAGYPPSAGPQGAFVRALYRDFLGRSASAAEVDLWVGRLAAGQSRHQVAAALSRSDEWITSVVTTFYRDTLGRSPDAAGMATWIREARSGRPMAEIAAEFYASPEYFAKYGGSDRATWLRDLYGKLLHRSPDAPGMRHWLDRLAAGTPRSVVAIEFYQSPETIRVRVENLYRAFLGRAADASGLRTWPPIMRQQGDLELAAFLASSDEYFARAGRS